jgi:hypothetical protein
LFFEKIGESCFIIATACAIVMVVTTLIGAMFYVLSLVIQFMAVPGYWTLHAAAVAFVIMVITAGLHWVFSGQ